MVPWRLQKRFFQPGQSVSTPVPTGSEVEKKKLEKKMKKGGRKPKKGKVNCPPPSVWRDVGTEDDIAKIALANQEETEKESDVAEGLDEEETEGVLEVDGETVQEEGENEAAEVTVADVEIEKEVEKAIDIDVEEDISPEGKCEHVVEEGNQLLFQRYCHVYEKGELEDLCSWYVIPSLIYYVLLNCIATYSIFIFIDAVPFFLH